MTKADRYLVPTWFGSQGATTRFSVVSRRDCAPSWERVWLCAVIGGWSTWVGELGLVRPAGRSGDVGAPTSLRSVGRCPGLNRRLPGCDASAALSRHSAVVARPVWTVDPELGDDGDRLAGRQPCVRGVNVRRTRVPHSRRSRDIPSQSAEPTGAVKASPSGPSAASREAVALTVAGRWSYGE
jgi:hypothetical protein